MYRVCLSPHYISLRPHPVMLRGTAGGEGNALIRFLYCGYFLTPPSLVTPPLYFAMQNTEEEVNTLRCIVFVFLPPYISLWKHPAMLRDMAGREGNALICFLCCGYFLTPPSLVTPPLYFAMQNTGEEVNTLRCIVFVFLLTIFLCGNTPQCYGTRQGGGLSSTLYSLL